MGPFGAVTVCVLAAGAWRGGHAWHCAQPCLGHCGGCCVSGFLWAMVDGECARGVSDHQNAEWCGAMLSGVVRCWWVWCDAGGYGDIIHFMESGLWCLVVPSRIDHAWVAACWLSAVWPCRQTQPGGHQSGSPFLDCKGAQTAAAALCKPFKSTKSPYMIRW